MSVKYMGLVFEADLPRQQRSILLAMADHVDSAGRRCMASEERIAYKTGYERRQVGRIIEQLQEVGILIYRGRSTKYGTQIYDIDKDKIPMLPSYEVWIANERAKRAAKKEASERSKHTNGQDGDATKCRILGGAEDNFPELPVATFSSELCDKMSQNPSYLTFNMLESDSENLLPQIPEAQKEEEDLISPESRTFWDMFAKRHQTIFGHPYNGPPVEMDTNPTLRTLQALDASERFDIVNQGLKAMAAAGQTGKIGSWALYETEIQRAIDDYAARQKANQVIGMFTMNLNEALVRCHLPLMTGTYSDKQRQEIAAWGPMLDADDLERTILLYADTHPNDKQPFLINVKLNWVITTAQRNKLAAASGAALAAKNGNGNGTHKTYRNGAAGNRAGSRSQASSQPAIDWDAAHERIEALYK